MSNVKSAFLFNIHRPAIGHAAETYEDIVSLQ
jgi:hypothetical protein